MSRRLFYQPWTPATHIVIQIYNPYSIISYMQSQAREHHGDWHGWADYAGGDVLGRYSPLISAIHLVRPGRQTDGVRRQPSLGSGGGPGQAAPGWSTEPSHCGRQPSEEIFFFRQFSLRPPGLIPSRRRHVPRPCRFDPALFLAAQGSRHPPPAAGYRGHVHHDCKHQLQVPAHGTPLAGGGGQLPQSKERQDGERGGRFPAARNFQEKIQAPGHGPVWIRYRPYVNCYMAYFNSLCYGTTLRFIFLPLSFPNNNHV